MQIANPVFQLTPFYADVQIANADFQEFAIRQIGPRELHLQHTTAAEGRQTCGSE
jgi:hypothetical protein